MLGGSAHSATPPTRIVTQRYTRMLQNSTVYGGQGPSPRPWSGARAVEEIEQVEHDETRDGNDRDDEHTGETAPSVETGPIFSGSAPDGSPTARSEELTQVYLLLLLLLEQVIDGMQQARLRRTAQLPALHGGIQGATRHGTP